MDLSFRAAGRVCLACALLGLAALVPPAAAQAGWNTLAPTAEVSAKRLALVIGNAAYTGVPALLNPANDARDMTAALQRLGFTVVTGTDLDQRQMETMLRAFAQQVEGAEVALVFYAGHGVEISGENFLLPVDLDGRVEPYELKHEAVSLDRVLGGLGTAGAALKILILDACRDNPFRSWRSLAGSGWAPPGDAVPSGTIVAYGTSPGTRASDNPDGRNGLFTSALLEVLERPGLEVSDMFQHAGRRVHTASGGGQEPRISLGYFGDFYFIPPGAPAPRPVTPPATTGPPIADPAAGIAAAASRSGAVVALPPPTAQTPPPTLAAPELTPAPAAPLPAETLPPVATVQPRPTAQPSTPAQTVPLPPPTTQLPPPTVQVAALPTLPRDASSLSAEATAARRIGDAARAVELYRAAAQTNQPDALVALGEMLARGEGAPRAVADAVELFGVAVDLGRTDAAHHLATLLLTEPGIRDEARALGLLRRAASVGYAPSVMALGTLFAEGTALPLRPDSARVYFERAAADYAPARTALGVLTLDGRGGPADARAAAALWRQAAADGDARAHVLLGDLVLARDVFDVGGSDALAAAHYRAAAEAGHAPAQSRLAALHYDGRGVARDHAEAARLYFLASEAGDPAGRYGLGRLLVLGHGVRQDAARGCALAEASGYEHAAALVGCP